MSKFSTQDIIRYLEGEMEEQERISFQEELDSDKSLKVDLELYLDVNATLKSHLAPDQRDHIFNSDLKQYHKKYFSGSKRGVKLFSIQKYWYAAAMLVLGLLLWAPWNKNLYQEYSGTQMVSVAERGENDQQLLIKATDEFNKENFVEAREILKQLVAGKPNDDMLRFYYGISLLETDEAKLARENFDKVYSGESIFKYDAAFYNALSYLKENNKERAKEWLLKIDAESEVYEKGQELLGKL
jgi:hypothetical protein